MPFYALLSVLTLLVAAMIVAVWFRTRNLGFVVGFAFIYYWTLFGAWRVISERQGAPGEHPFTYLYYKMFPVYLDQDYALALILYAGFVLSVQAAVIWFARPAREETGREPIEISHAKLLGISAASYAVSYLIIRNALNMLSDMNMSGYVLVSQMTPLWNVHSILSALSGVSVVIGLAVWFSGQHAKYLRGRRSFLILAGYLGLLCFMFSVALRLGDRRSMLIAALTGSLFYLANAGKRSVSVLLVGGLAGVLIVVLPGITRDQYKIQDLQRQGFVKGIFSAVTGSGNSAESAAAHLSMYGVLHYHVPIDWGGSVVPLIASVVPSFLWPERPADAYAYYAKSVGALEGQGYTIHHATGWYLNFGIPGVFAGGIFVGSLWAFLFNAFVRGSRSRSQPLQVLSVLSFWTFTGYVPALLRIPIEGYKAVLLEGILAPACVITLASVGFVMREGRPIVIPLRRRLEEPAYIGDHN